MWQCTVIHFNVVFSLTPPLIAGVQLPCLITRWCNKHPPSSSIVKIPHPIKLTLPNEIRQDDDDDDDDEDIVQST